MVAPDAEAAVANRSTLLARLAQWPTSPIALDLAQGAATHLGPFYASDAEAARRAPIAIDGELERVLQRFHAWQRRVDQCSRSIAWSGARQRSSPLLPVEGQVLRPVPGLYAALDQWLGSETLPKRKRQRRGPKCSSKELGSRIDKELRQWTESSDLQQVSGKWHQWTRWLLGYFARRRWVPLLAQPLLLHRQQHWHTYADLIMLDLTCNKLLLVEMKTGFEPLSKEQRRRHELQLALTQRCSATCYDEPFDCCFLLYVGSRGGVRRPIELNQRQIDAALCRLPSPTQVALLSEESQAVKKRRIDTSSN